MKTIFLPLLNRLRSSSGVMIPTNKPTDSALSLLGKDANNVTQTAAVLGISPGAMLAAAWRVLERQSTDAQPWPAIAGGWCDEASATRQDVILAAVRIDADHRRKRKVAA